MKTIHNITKYKQIIEKDTGNASFFLTNKKEGFAWVNNAITSRYQGIFFSIDNKIFRVIESLIPEEKIDKVINNFYIMERKSKKNTETFFMPEKLNAFSYESNKPVEVNLDFKEPYENDYANYLIESNKEFIIVNIEYKTEKYYLVIRHNGKFKGLKRYLERFYEYDKERSSFPVNRTIFSIGKINSKKIIFYLSKNKEEAIYKSKEFFDNLEIYKKKKKKSIDKILKKLRDPKISIAYNSCRLLLYNLTSDKGLYAGLPWFFQYWSRDELISLKALYSIDKNSAKIIEEKWLRCLGNGWFSFPAKYKTDNYTEGISIDSMGWLLKRIELFPNLIKKYKKDILWEIEKLDSDIIETKRNTWMDSIERDCPIEIQAMKLYAFKFAYKITKNNYFKRIERSFKEKVLKEFFINDMLYDSKDKKIRPNVFIAYYFYRDLLTKKQWEAVFNKAIKELWLDWGGFSTLNKKDPLYHDNYTGEMPGSYHNGDSWFWINNLAGFCMLELNKKKYLKYIFQIIDASTKELLFIQAIGNHGELSSASELRSQGSPSQTFSAAMYLEMIDRYNKNRLFLF